MGLADGMAWESEQGHSTEKRTTAPISGVQSTKGHCAGNGGLRGHSVGEAFPCVIIAVGNPHEKLVWRVMQPNGFITPDLASYDDALAAAKSYNNPVKDDQIYFLETRKVQLVNGEEVASYPMCNEVPFTHYALYGVGKDGDGVYLHLCDYSNWKECHHTINCIYAEANYKLASLGKPYREILNAIQAGDYAA